MRCVGGGNGFYYLRHTTCAPQVGETMYEVAGKGGTHIMTTTDAAHQPMRDQMKNGTEEGKKKWFAWFKTVWDKKA